MANSDFNTSGLINHFVVSSENDYTTMKSLFNSGHYTWALFIGHISLEKLLKAYYVKVLNDYPPRIHNLLRLAEKAGLDVDIETAEDFDVITTFNIEARYENIKRDFFNKCDLHFTKIWMNKIEGYRLWITKML